MRNQESLCSYAVAVFAIAVLRAGPGGAATLKTIYSVSGATDGANPNGLIEIGGVFYGTTVRGGATGNGTVFAIDAATGKEKLLHSFGLGNDGRSPSSALIALGGVLYGTTDLGGATGNGTVFSIDPSSGTEKLVFSLGGGKAGGDPTSVIAAGGILYGTALQGGLYGGGTVFAIDPATGTEKIIHSFGAGQDAKSPGGPLIDVDGILYGTASAGGFSGNGAVVSIDPASGMEEVVHAFDGSDGAAPEGGLIEQGGILYGVANQGGKFGLGTVFSTDPTTGIEKVLYSFNTGGDGSHPAAALIAAGSLLYGTTTYGGMLDNGTVFSIDPATGAEKVLYRFAGGPDGAGPQGSLIDAGGLLYGAAASGGAAGDGIVFSIDAATGTEKQTYGFTGAPDGSFNYLLNVNGTLFLSASTGGGAGLGSVTQIQPATATATQLYAFPDRKVGAYPMAPLTAYGGSTLYGTTNRGGSHDRGIVFSLDTATKKLQLIHDFGGGSDGAYPAAALLAMRGLLYGTTQSGGLSGKGTVFSINPATGAETLLYSFAGGNDGDDPEAALIDVGGNLYGTTVSGGTQQHGTLFSIDPSTGVEKVLYRFGGAGDGAYPAAALVDAGGTIFGTTQGGGVVRCGTVFSFNPATKAENVLYSLYPGAGCGPAASLIDLGGLLYGTTENSGATGYGTVFSIDPASGMLKILYSFGGKADGGYPSAALVGIGGTLYGATAAGGRLGRGTVFELVP